MKTSIYTGIFALMFIACTKTNIQPVSTNLSASSQDMMKVSKANTILTSHIWQYNAFYMHYIDENHKGNPLYVRGAQNNQDEILATDRFVFKPNHNFVQTENGYTYKGKWHFSDHGATTLFMQYHWGTDEDSIINFNSDHLEFIQSFGYHDQDHSYTELIPVN